MPPSSTRQRQAVQQVMEFTGCGESVAKSILKTTNYDVLQANNLILDQLQNKQRGTGKPADKSKPKLEELFNTYRAKEDEPDEIGISGTMKYLTDLGVNLEGEDSSSLVALEIVGSPAVGVMTKDNFVNGWIKASAGGKKPLDNLPAQKAYVESQISQLTSDIAMFKRVYRHTFFSAKEKSLKAIDLETATVYWQMLLGETGLEWKTDGVNWLDLWLEFLGENWKKTVSKDMWNQTAEFAIKTLSDPCLSFYSDEGAWPSVIDDFVAWYRKKNAS